MPAYKTLVNNGSALGFFLGDELLWNGLTFKEMSLYATVVRESFPVGQCCLHCACFSVTGRLHAGSLHWGGGSQIFLH